MISDSLQALPSSKGGGSDSDRVKLDSRERILRAALSEFAEVGFEGARVDRIAERAGINKAMLYYHFGAKDELYLESVRHHVERVVPKIWAGVRESVSLDEALSMLAAGHLELYRAAPEIIPIILREAANRNSRVMAMITSLFSTQGLPELLIDHITKEQEKGSIRKLDPRLILMNFSLFSVSYYLVGHAWMGVLGLKETPEFLDQRRKMIVDVYLHGLRDRTAEQAA